MECKTLRLDPNSYWGLAAGKSILKLSTDLDWTVVLSRWFYFQAIAVLAESFWIALWQVGTVKHLSLLHYIKLLTGLWCCSCCFCRVWCVWWALLLEVVLRWRCWAACTKSVCFDNAEVGHYTVCRRWHRIFNVLNDPSVCCTCAWRQDRQ